MHRLARPNRPPCKPAVIHDLVCQHRMEVEVWPASAEVFFLDERFAHPVNSQVRFDAVVYNAPTDRVTWEVKNLSGSSGAGSIDPSGLYTAPPKGTFPNGITDIIVATSVDDPFRKAYGQVSLIGHGPEPKPDPTIEISPKKSYLYYPGGHNAYIDESNKMQFFRTTLRNIPSAQLVWEIGSHPPIPWNEPWYLFKVNEFLSFVVEDKITITARLNDEPAIKDEAVVFLLNYSWPGL